MLLYKIHVFIRFAYQTIDVLFKILVELLLYLLKGPKQA